MDAETLRWEDARRRLVSGPEETVALTRDDGSQVTGVGLQVDVRRKTIRFSGPVSGTLVCGAPWSWTPAAPPRTRSGGDAREAGLCGAVKKDGTRMFFRTLICDPSYRRASPPMTCRRVRRCANSGNGT